jgi:hypothetical protein
VNLKILNFRYIEETNNPNIEYKAKKIDEAKRPSKISIK